MIPGTDESSLVVFLISQYFIAPQKFLGPSILGAIRYHPYVLRE